MDLFDDLPEPVNNDDATENQNRGGKRKVQDEDKSENKKAHVISSSDIQIVFRGYVAEIQGEREDMQDSHVVIDNFEPQIEDMQTRLHVALYAVFDGHGGMRASKYAAAHLPGNVALKFPKELSQIDRDVGKCFIDAYKKTDDEFLKEASRHKPTWKDGTTALTVLAVNDTLYIANLGDSKAVLCRYNNELQKYVSIALSKDHSPTQYDERMRIQKMGGTVRDGRVMGILEVSRSIGDGQYKTCGVICTPDVKRCQLTDNDRFVILACDGLWKVFSPDEAISFIVNMLEDNFVNKAIISGASYETACFQLAKEAVRKGSGDNVTVVVVSITRSST